MTTHNHKTERIAKRIARAGLCSRREAERWIDAGRVVVNGEKLQTPACVVSAADDIRVDGKPLPDAEDTRLFLYHKPVGLVTSHKDEKGRDTVFDRLPSEIGRVVSIGRLDLNTEGLLMLTNDGGLSRYLELPATGWRRKYRVRVHGAVKPKRLAALKDGITVEGVRYKGIDASVEETRDMEKLGRANTWLNITLREGKNREIRKVMEALGLQVSRLIRVSYGPFQLGNLRTGAVSEVTQKVLHDQVGGYFKDKS